MDPAKITAVLNWPVLDSRKLQQFLGFTICYCCFVSNYSSVVVPLTALTSVKKPLVWSPEANATGWRGAKLPFLVSADHKNLEYISLAKRLNSRQARWALFCTHFDFSLSYHPGSRNGKLDALSRQFVADGDQVGGPPPILSPPCGSFPDNGRGGETARHLSLTARTQFMPGQSPFCSLDCHPGVRWTCALLQQWFWWPSLEEDVMSYIRACVSCSSHQTSVGLLQSLLVAGRPWSLISLDFVTGLPFSKGNSVILIIDRFSKMAHFVPLQKLPSAKEVFCLHVDVVLEWGSTTFVRLLDRVLQAGFAACLWAYALAFSQWCWRMWAQDRATLLRSMCR